MTQETKFSGGSQEKEPKMKHLFTVRAFNGNYWHNKEHCYSMEEARGKVQEGEKIAETLVPENWGNPGFKWTKAENKLSQEFGAIVEGERKDLDNTDEY